MPSPMQSHAALRQAR